MERWTWSYDLPRPWVHGSWFRCSVHWSDQGRIEPPPKAAAFGGSMRQIEGVARRDHNHRTVSPTLQHTV